MSDYQDKIDKLLSMHVMFSSLSAGDKKALRQLFEHKVYHLGDVIAEQFTTIDGVYCVSSGKVLVKQTIEGRRERIGEFDQEEGTFGELSLIKTCSWEMRLEAHTTNVTILKLPAKSVQDLLKKRPAMANTFRKYIGKIVLSQRLRAMLGVAKCEISQFNEILSSFGVKKIEKGQQIFHQGDKDPRLYLIEKGSVDIVKNIQDEDIIIDRCLQGELVGEMAALEETGTEGVHPYTAMAVTNVTAIVIKEAEVKKILSINPELHTRLRERTIYLRDAEKAEVDSISRTESRDMRIKLEEGVTAEEFRQLEKQKVIEKVPIVRQGDETECGAACLTMITRFYEKNFNLGQIKELTNLSSAQDSPMSIITGAESLGISARGYALKYKDLEDVKLPGIIGWEGSHYAVVYRATSKKVYLVDPAEGQKNISREEFITGWTRIDLPGVETKEDQGLFIGLTPTTKFTRLTPPKKPINHFIDYLLPFKYLFMEALIAALILNLLGLATPLFIQTIVDTVVVHKDVSLLNMMLGGMVLVTIFTTLTRVIQRLLLAHTTARVDMVLMSEFYRHILSLPLSFFLTRNKGEILARFGENTKIRAMITGSTVTIILNTLMLIVYFLMMFGYSSKLTIIVIIFIPGYIGLILFFTPRIKAISQKIFLTNTKAQSFLIESLNGIETIKATANEYMARARWENAFVENVNNGFQQAKLVLISNSLHGLLSLASNVIILWLGATQVINGMMTIGELMGFNMLVNLVMAPVQQMVQLWNQLQEIRISIDRVSDVLNVNPEQEPISTPEKMPIVLKKCQGKIDFSKVNFSYMIGSKENLVMKDFNLTIESGQNVAFVGPSGCGKSTIAKMILGFNIPKTGECRIDGKSIVDLDLLTLRRNIGIVLQDSFLIAGTVAQNIALGDPEPDMQSVKNAAKLAGIDSEILKWPLGYQTSIGEKGMGISGGQRQRVCIARALYWQPKILIFDEATSALDNESEKIIQGNMNKILKGRTSITIAHRLSTILDADMICYINQGKVLEKGTHQKLTDPLFLKKMGYAGHYYKLAQGQFNLTPLDLKN